MATVSSITALLGIINIGSSIAFSDCLSLILEALYTSYLIVCLIFLYRRVRGQIGSPSTSSVPVRVTEANDPTKNPALLQWGPWHVRGLTGILVNSFAIIYLAIISFFSFWPLEAEVTASSMNYSVLVTGGVAIFSIVYYFTSARRTYRGPIVELDSSDLGTELSGHHA